VQIGPRKINIKIKWAMFLISGLFWIFIACQKEPKCSEKCQTVPKRKEKKLKAKECKKLV